MRVVPGLQTSIQKSLRKDRTKRAGLLEVPDLSALCETHELARVGGDTATQAEPLLDELGIGCEGHLAVASQPPAKFALGAHRKMGGVMLQGQQSVAHVFALTETFKRKCSLACRRQTVLGRENSRDPRTKSQPSEPCCGKHNRMVFPAVELRKPRIQVAAQRKQAQIRSPGQQLARASEA